METRSNPLFEEISSMNFLQMSYDALVTSFFKATKWCPPAWIITVDMIGFAILFGLVVASNYCSKTYFLYLLGIFVLIAVIAMNENKVIEADSPIFFMKFIPLYIIAMSISDLEVRSREKPLDALRKLDYVPSRIKSICMISLIICLGSFD